MRRSVSRVHHLVAAASIAVAVTAALFVSPAAAGTSPAGRQAAAAYCDPFAPAGSQMLDLLAGLRAGRGADVREPDLGQVVQDLPAPAKGKAGKDFKATVPVVFHVVSDGTIGNVSDRAIAEQIRVMNRGYGGVYGGADTGFRFELVDVTRTDNAEWFYAGPTTSGEREMKHALHQGGPDTLNIYSTTAGPYLGWAYLPSIVNTPGQAYLDGLVIDWESMVHTSTTYEGRYDLGLTAVHESGHWFNLEHTFYGGCNHFGDFVADTSAELVPTSGCPADGTKDTCTRDPGFDPIHNYMDYSYDQCYREFTPGQAQRQRDSWLYYRAPE